MMHFERNGKAKESMGIGLTGEALEISSIKGELTLRWETKRTNLKSRDYKLKKRWYIPMRTALSIMKMEKVSVWKLRRVFKASSQEPDFLETFWQFVTPWICIYSRNQKIKKCKKYAEVDIYNMKVKKYNDSSSNKSDLKFIVISDDMEKIMKIQDSGKPLDKVIYNEKIYEINPDFKTLR